MSGLLLCQKSLCVSDFVEKTIDMKIKTNVFRRVVSAVLSINGGAYEGKPGSFV